MRGYLLLSLAAVSLGCASSSKKQVTELRQRLDDLSQNETATQRRLEEMNNRLFLLEDKVDTTRIAAQRSRGQLRLPVIRIKPADIASDETSKQPLGRWAGEEGETAADAEGEEGQAGAVAEEDNQDPEPGPGDGRRSLVDAREVKYSGNAHRGGPRPVLRLHGERRAGRASAAGVARRDPAEFSENEKLGVVPLPKKRAADVAGAREMYSQAMAQYRAGRYGAAAAAFKRFVGRHARHAYADNALYWLGECFYDQKDYRLALGMFRRVVEEHPHGNKTPDALLKMGYCYLKLQEKKNARSVLAQVVEIFPKTNSARLASDALAKLQ